MLVVFVYFILGETMKIYNTLSKKKEEFHPIDPPNVKMYVCGPTVYDYFHIGNARSFIMADIIRRYLIYKGFNVKFVMNLTDVDDKIIKKSNEENITPSEIAERYIKFFFDDIEKLKIKKADVYPKATQHIDEIINIIKKLESKGIAYNKEGNVFYNVSKFKEYGKLSGKKIEELEAGSRIEINEEKNNPLDFSLWKKAKHGEPFWQSPWGKGRPGWHIECSAMSMKHLGETFDIHAGGHDLIFPHHENEIAQSQGATGKQFVKYWVHFGFLNFQNEKMSKSLGNFFTAREVVKKFSPEAIRLLFCQTHYASPLSFSNQLLHSAEKALEKITNFIRTVKYKENSALIDGEYPEFNIQHYYDKFEEAMDDDFNSSKAVAVIFDLVKEVNKIIDNSENLGEIFFQDILEFLNVTAEGVLGIIPKTDENQKDEEAVDKLLNLIIEIRTIAKEEKNYKLADKIRDELSRIGFLLRDGKDGTVIIKHKNNS